MYDYISIAYTLFFFTVVILSWGKTKWKWRILIIFLLLYLGGHLPNSHGDGDDNIIKTKEIPLIMHFEDVTYLINEDADWYLDIEIYNTDPKRDYTGRLFVACKAINLGNHEVFQEYQSIKTYTLKANSSNVLRFDNGASFDTVNHYVSGEKIEKRTCRVGGDRKQALALIGWRLGESTFINGVNQ